MGLNNGARPDSLTNSHYYPVAQSSAYKMSVIKVRYYFIKVISPHQIAVK